MLARPVRPPLTCRILVLGRQVRRPNFSRIFNGRLSLSHTAHEASDPRGPATASHPPRSASGRQLPTRFLLNKLTRCVLQLKSDIGALRRCLVVTDASSSYQVDAIWKSPRALPSIAQTDGLRRLPVLVLCLPYSLGPAGIRTLG